MTLDGWIPLGELKVGDRLAVPRRVPEPVETQRMEDSEVILLAHMIGDGSCVKNQPIRYASIDEGNLAAVTTAAKHFGVTAVRDDYPAARVRTLRLPAPYHLTHRRRNPIAAWLDELGLFGKRSYDKFVPEAVFRAPERPGRAVPAPPVGDGRLRAVGRQGRPGTHLLRVDESALVDDVAMLLLRLGVFRASSGCERRATATDGTCTSTAPRIRPGSFAM